MRRYRARRTAAGLRASTHWQSAASRALTPGLLKHRILEVRSLAMHCLIARKIALQPKLLDTARRNIAAWSARYGDDVPIALQQWRAILDRPWNEVAAILCSADESAVRLRQSSPFAGVLTQSERRRVYEAFRS